MNYTDEQIQENVEKLEDFLKKFTYKDKWSFGINKSVPRMFVIGLETEDSTGQYDPYFSNEMYSFLERRAYGHLTNPEFGDHYTPFTVAHVFHIPVEPMDQKELERYVLDRILDVDRHEAMENFKIGGFAPFFPDHDHVEKLYAIHNRRVK